MLVDFGLVRDLKTDRKETTSGKGMGTPLYIAPEQITSDHGIDARADIYSLGATLYHALAGKPPFQGSAIKEVLRKHIKEAPVPLKELWLDIPDALSDIVSQGHGKKAGGTVPVGGGADTGTAKGVPCHGGRRIQTAAQTSKNGQTSFECIDWLKFAR